MTPFPIWTISSLRDTTPSLQAEGITPGDWFAACVRTYVERDVRQIRNIENLLLFERLLALCAGRIGQQPNYSNLAVETGLDAKTMQAWLGVLQASYIIFLLPPFYRRSVPPAYRFYPGVRWRNGDWGKSGR